jgi:SH3 domain protein
LTQAKDFYVSGYREIEIRTGPGEQNNAFATLKTGQKMQRVSQEGDYYLVKIPDGRRGYVLKKNLTDKAPPEYQLSELEAKVKQQAQEIKQLRQENNGLIEAADVQANREAEVKTELEQLQADRSNIQHDRNLTWFLAGAGVLLVGWLIGWRFKLRSKSRYQGLSFS